MVCASCRARNTSGCHPSCTSSKRAIDCVDETQLQHHGSAKSSKSTSGAHTWQAEVAPIYASMLDSSILGKYLEISIESPIPGARYTVFYCLPEAELRVLRRQWGLIQLQGGMHRQIALHAFFVQEEKRFNDVDNCQYVLSSTPKQNIETSSDISISRIRIEAVTEQLWTQKVVLRPDTTDRAAVERQKNSNSLKLGENWINPIELDREPYWNFMESKPMTAIIRTCLPYVRQEVELRVQSDTSLTDVLEDWWNMQTVPPFHIPPMSELVITTSWNNERFDWPGLLLRDVAFRDMTYMGLRGPPDKIFLDVMSKGENCMYIFRTIYLTPEVDVDEVESWGSLDVKPGTDHGLDGLSELSGFYGSEGESLEPPAIRFNAIASWLARLE